MSRQTNRRRFDDEDYEPQPNLSSFVDAQRGPQPPPEWVILSADAVDDDLGVMKTGKEATPIIPHCARAADRRDDVGASCGDVDVIVEVGSC